MRIIITGGAGLIGRALSKSLINDGHEVIILSRSPELAAVPEGATVQKWDARSAKGWGHLVEETDAIVNLAGAGLADGRWTDSRKARIRNSRLNTGRAVVQAVKNAEKKPEVVIQASAVGYYGPRDNSILTEEAVPGNDFVAKICIDWEAATASVESMGVRRAILRTGLVLSTEDGALPRMMLPFKFFVGGPVGGGRQWMSWIHLADEVAAIRFLIDNQDAAGRFNLTAPNPVTNAEFSKVLGRVMGRPALMPAPALAVKLLFGEMASVVLTGQRVVPQRLLDAGFTFQFTKLEAALEDLLP